MKPLPHCWHVRTVIPTNKPYSWWWTSCPPPPRVSPIFQQTHPCPHRADAIPFYFVITQSHSWKKVILPLETGFFQMLLEYLSQWLNKIKRNTNLALVSGLFCHCSTNWSIIDSIIESQSSDVPCIFWVQCVSNTRRKCEREDRIRLSLVWSLVWGRGQSPRQMASC